MQDRTNCKRIGFAVVYVFLLTTFGLEAQSYAHASAYMAEAVEQSGIALAPIPPAYSTSTLANVFGVSYDKSRISQRRIPGCTGSGAGTAAADLVCRFTRSMQGHELNTWAAKYWPPAQLYYKARRAVIAKHGANFNLSRYYSITQTIIVKGNSRWVSSVTCNN